MNKHIKQLIAQGEHEQLDFKYEISDSRKMARTFAAFANTSGGTLLIGVKDNGVITGIKTDEEIYMAESAAELFCDPPVPYNIQNWNIDNKWVLEITVPKSKQAPHVAPWKNNKKLAFIRIDDQNHLANVIIYKALKFKNNPEKNILVQYKNEESRLLKFLSEEKEASLSQIKKALNTTGRITEKILINLVSIDLITYTFKNKSFHYSINQNIE